MDTKFSFDNVNRKLVAAGVYATKNSGKAQGYFSFSIPPQYQEGDKINVYSQVFDDDFVSALLGKKTTDNKGVFDIKIQEIVHRRDGGILAIFEQVKLVERRIATSSGLGRYVSRGDALSLAMDYYHDNFLRFPSVRKVLFIGNQFFIKNNHRKMMMDGIRLIVSSKRPLRFVFCSMMKSNGQQR
jgi:hypothetical protein